MRFNSLKSLFIPFQVGTQSDELLEILAMSNPRFARPLWHLVDAQNQVAGRLATQVVGILRGKHKPRERHGHSFARAVEHRSAPGINGNNGGLGGMSTCFCG